MQARQRTLLIVAAVALYLPLSAVLAFFLAGAVVFPIIEPHYASRVLLSLGLMAVVYGIECVLSWGRIETCGFLSGNCTTHVLQGQAVLLWYGLLGLGLLVALVLLARSGAQPGSGRDD